MGLGRHTTTPSPVSYHRSSRYPPSLKQSIKVLLPHTQPRALCCKLLLSSCQVLTHGNLLLILAKSNVFQEAESLASIALRLFAVGNLMRVAQFQSGIAATNRRIANYSTSRRMVGWPAWSVGLPPQIDEWRDGVGWKHGPVGIEQPRSSNIG